MLTDLKIENAKKEYVEAINEINQKYELPLTICEVLLCGIINEVTRMKNEKLDFERKQLESENK